MRLTGQDPKARDHEDVAEDRAVAQPRRGDRHGGLERVAWPPAVPRRELGLVVPVQRRPQVHEVDEPDADASDDVGLGDFELQVEETRRLGFPAGRGVAAAGQQALQHHERLVVISAVHAVFSRCAITGCHVHWIFILSNSGSINVQHYRLL